MSFYHELADPLTKEAMPLLKTVGRSLLNRGAWGTAARAGEKLVERGGRLGQAGGYLATGAGAMQKASPYLLGYGLTGLVGQVSGKFDLPGSSLAFNAAAPGWGALTAAAPAIQSARLATGKYNDQIKADAQRGATQAGTDWITATQRNGQTAYDPAAYTRMLQENGFDTEAADRYLDGGPAQQPGWYRRLGNVFENPMGNVMPEVQRGIYDQLHKGASEMEKEAMAAAAKAAWKLSRSVGAAAPEFANFARSGLRAGKAGWQASAPSMYMRANPWAAKLPGRALNTAFIGSSLYGIGDAATSEKPYDEAQVIQAGYDGGQAGIRQGVAGMTPFQRQMVKWDPSLAVQRMEGQLPGAIAGWEQQNSQAYQPGFLGAMSQFGQSIGGAASAAWNVRGTPEFYNYDGEGAAKYL